MRARILSYLLLAILLIGPVQGFGISYDYMENKTLELYPGQTYMFKLTVQNKDKEEVKVNISLDSAIARLVGGPILEVLGQTYDTHVFFNITVPEDAQPGDIYNINYAVSPVGRGEGQVPISVRYARNFKVRVVPKPKEAEKEQSAPIPEKPIIPRWLVILVVIIVILALLTLIWRKSHQISRRITKKKPGQRITQSKHNPPKKYKPEIKAKPNPGPEEHLGHAQHRALSTQQKKTLEPHPYFHLKDGRTLTDLEDLYHALKNMREDIFNYHVNSTKNDFANWVAHSLKKQELANKLFRTTSHQKIMELIKNELKKR